MLQRTHSWSRTAHLEATSRRRRQRRRGPIPHTPAPKGKKPVSGREAHPRPTGRLAWEARCGT
eukprot:2248471-Prymnesium_polylepis.1